MRWRLCACSAHNLSNASHSLATVAHRMTHSHANCSVRVLPHRLPVLNNTPENPRPAPFVLAGLGLQVLQQAAGINTVMYYTPAILELAGFRDKRSALLIALLPAGGATEMRSSEDALAPAQLPLCVNGWLANAV